ncbi:hypothetical protein NECAME_18342 [Necator americanus]|uniref:Uncharacterized protein n=1 Tax=Necator americanus TaxID=51031 RepID=W2SX62_NECAM|nr:hypothetical protein NECAME_18342 [Necator americanus]ETN73426.1 hypothetical protein NECAME_18342 [Necator americanus]
MTDHSRKRSTICSIQLLLTVFRKNTYGLPRLILNPEWKRIVAVGFDDNNLSDIVEWPQGTSLMIPESFTRKHVDMVVEDVLEGF